MSTISFTDLPQEILVSIASVLTGVINRSCLVALLKTARFLRPAAEYVLYHTVECWKSRSCTVKFIRTITSNGRLGLLVRSFAPYKVPHNDHKYHDDVAIAMRSMPNLKSLKVGNDIFQLPRPLRRISEWGVEVQPFQLERLEVDLGFVREILKKTWYPSQLGQDLLRLLQRQRSLRQLRLNIKGDLPSDMVPPESHWTDLSMASSKPKPLDQIKVSQWRKACASLEVLEGSRTAIRLLLPGATGVKAVFWHFGQRRSEERTWASGWDAARIVEEGWGDLFTSELCEAYGRLEHLVVAYQIYMLPVLVPFLTSLKTLVLYIAGSPFIFLGWGEEEEKSALLDTIVQISNLETLAIIQEPRRGINFDLEPQVVFARCPKLREFVCMTCDMWADGEDAIIVAMERGKDGTVRHADYGVILRRQYVMGGWISMVVD